LYAQGGKQKGEGKGYGITGTRLKKERGGLSQLFVYHTIVKEKKRGKQVVPRFPWQGGEGEERYRGPRRDREHVQKKNIKKKAVKKGKRANEI